jgi:transposase
MENKNYDYIAIDVSKSELEIKTEQRHCRVCNNLKGFKELAKLAEKENHPLVVFESSGGYERELMDYLHQSQMAVTRVNPSRIRSYAHSEGIKAKTDPIDASMINAFTWQLKQRPSIIP